MAHSSKDKIAEEMVSKHSSNDYSEAPGEPGIRSGIFADLDQLDKAIGQLALEVKDDNRALLRLLRVLENTHRTIRELYFQPSLPRNRQQLYSLLREMETEGGWPYIPRMRLRQLLENFKDEV